VTGETQVQQDNIAVARRSFELYSDGGPDAARATWAGDCVWNDPSDLPDAAVYRGPEAVAARLNDLEIEQAAPINDSEVLLILGFHGKGGGSGIPVDQPMGCIVTIRDGLCAEWRPFLNQDEARKAAGL
jgi:ketosteroid isomerase-like protein